jgi:succinate dehydrogenase / fumarate reductase cytochrome b subunit
MPTFMGATTTAVARKPSPVAAWLFSSIGKKTIVAVTGILLVGFIAAHLGGNLTFFFGPDAINSYAVHLRDLGPLLWLARIGLLVAVGLHIFFTMKLWQENHTARPDKYAVKSRVQSTVFARTMRLSGLIVLAFVVFHLAHFTWMIVYPDYRSWHDAAGRHDVFRMIVAGFSLPLVSGFYILSLALLASHLSHGIGSLFQTLGISNRRLQPLFTSGGKIVAWALFAGFAAIPVSVLLGFGHAALK